MPNFHPSEPDGSHRCPHCGARYKVSWGNLPARDADQESCHCCKQEMARWNATSYPIFELDGDCPGDENVRFIQGG